MFVAPPSDLYFVHVLHAYKHSYIQNTKYYSKLAIFIVKTVVCVHTYISVLLCSITALEMLWNTMYRYAQPYIRTQYRYINLFEALRHCGRHWKVIGTKALSQFRWLRFPVRIFPIPNMLSSTTCHIFNYIHTLLQYTPRI